MYIQIINKRIKRIINTLNIKWVNVSGEGGFVPKEGTSVLDPDKTGVDIQVLDGRCVM